VFQGPVQFLVNGKEFVTSADVDLALLRHPSHSLRGSIAASGLIARRLRDATGRCDTQRLRNYRVNSNGHGE
jgi:hypothetical protein